MVLVADGERFGIVAAAAAHFTHHINVGKKIHFDAAKAVALAGFAAAALDVKAEAAGAVAAFARFRKHGKEIANGREDAGVGGGIRARRAADWGLIDFDDFVDVLGADNFAVRGGRFGRAIEFLRERAIKNVVTSVDLPEPETPVTTVSRPSGSVMSTSLRLLALAPRICIALPLGLRRFSGTSILAAPLRY